MTVGAGMSILATLVSTVSILGGPADFFRYGFVPAPVVPFFRPLFFYKAVPQQYTS